MSEPIERFGAGRWAGFRTGDLIGVLCVVYLVAKPFYLFSSGLPQVADMVVILMLGLVFLGGMSLKTGALASFLKICAIFSTYTVIVSLIWGLVLNDLKVAASASYYVFNVGMAAIVVAGFSFSGEKFSRILALGVAISVGLQAALAIVLAGASPGRETLFFNNPNQLGYWGLLSTTIFCVTMRRIRWPVLAQVFVFVAAAYLVALSLSKAAGISLALLLTLHFSKSFWQFGLFLIGSLAIVFVFQDTAIGENLANRLSNIGHQSDDSLGGRGYDRILDHPEHLIFGAGEWGLERFPNESNEMHSIFGTVLFSYGVIGFGLFVFLIVRHIPVRDWIYLIPPFAYGVTHQGLRSTLFWVLLATLAATATSISRKPPTQTA
ncbi:MAG: hypothetical protein ACI8UO_003014 [Verrucomicrobiales bacterium]|jgi:hypothetical protein